MLETVICAGLGGQGVLTAGKILMYVAYDQDLKVTWFPAYGNEMRGGNASCNVVISDKRIASPYCDSPHIVLAMSESAIAKRLSPTLNACLVIRTQSTFMTMRAAIPYLSRSST